MASVNSEEFHFSIHGTTIKYCTASPLLAIPITHLMHCFRSDVFQGPVDFVVQFNEVSCRREIPIVVDSSSERLFSRTGTTVGDRHRTAWRCDVVRQRGRLIIDCHEEGLVTIEDRTGETEGYVVRPDEMPSAVVEWFFHLALTELMKRRGAYTLHATALERDGLGILIPGNSGQGKTTAFLSLLRAGYRYLSDDHPFIRQGESELELLPFPMKIDVTEQTIALFPELQTADPAVFHPGFIKRYFHTRDIYSSPLGAACRPAMIVFPQIVDASSSQLELLSKRAALAALLPQGMVVYDQEIARKEFDVMAALVRQADCYVLRFGRDILELPQLIEPFFNSISLPAAAE